jgi:hypothetical protein
MGRGRDVELCELRMRTTRDLWDPNYQQESWVRDASGNTPVALIRRVKKWIAEINPGMEMCIGEYNFGGADNITGALAQAEVFGVMAREGLDLAFIWASPEGTQELGWKLFRSYDGNKGRFADRYVACESDRPELSVFAGRRSSDKALTVILINKDLHRPCTVNLDAGLAVGTMRAWRFDQDSADALNEVREASGAFAGKADLTVPAASATILVIAPASK